MSRNYCLRVEVLATEAQLKAFSSEVSVFWKHLKYEMSFYFEFHDQ